MSEIKSKINQTKIISKQEADYFLTNKKKDSIKIANAVFMCIISPSFLILLAGFSDNKKFAITEASDCGINLMYLPLDDTAKPPKFKECAKHQKVEDKGFVLYYTDQCPFTYYWVPRVEKVAKEHKIPFQAIHVTSREKENRGIFLVK